MKKLILFGLVAGVASLTGFASTDTPALWKSKCAKCHGAEGAGDTKMGKKLKITDMTTVDVQAKFTDEAIFASMKEGVINEKGKKRMKPVKGLSDEEMQALIPFVRGLVK